MSMISSRISSRHWLRPEGWTWAIDCYPRGYPGGNAFLKPMAAALDPMH
jgi:hypothetical protein